MQPITATGTAPVTAFPQTYNHDTTTRTRCYGNAMIRRYLSVAEVANSLSVSTETVIRQFSGRDGVIDIGTAETLHKRGKRLLRISEQAFERYVQEKQVKARRR